jgi:hypothetical protein
MWNPFEYPFVGIALGLLTFIVLWVYRTVRPEKKKRWHYFLPLGIYIFSFALAFLIRTDNEKITSVVNRGIRGFQQQQIQPIEQIIAENYSDSLHSSKAYIVAYCQAMFQTAAIEKVTFFSRKTEIQGGKATFLFEAMVKFTEQSHIAQMGKPFIIVKARFYLAKTADKHWLINSSEILELDRNPIDWNQIPK